MYYVKENDDAEINLIIEVEKVKSGYTLSIII